MSIQRELIETLQLNLIKHKVILLFGARQTGKTTLLKKLLTSDDDVLWLNGDESDVRLMLQNQTSAGLRAFIGAKKTVIIDEAQRIEDIGLTIKLIHDNYPEIKIIATGSSAFELKNKTNEPLTGRKLEFKLFQFSTKELVNHHGLLNENRLLQHRMIFGYYPDIVNNLGDETELLKNLADSYLFKDILMLDGIKKPEKLIKLLQALAFQVGSQVSYNEIGTLVGLDSKTIEKYVDLLEQSFVIFKLNSFSRNLRNELKFSRKIYFYDNGIRNAVINNFSPLAIRQDTGMLWENYLVSERMKRNHYDKNYCNSFFWRTKAQQEVDYLEEKNGKLFAYEFKWNSKKNAKITKTFTSNYPEAEINIITPENYLDFVL
ncbi:ATP-binding protein [Flavobacterium sp.]|jgi:predicted AAA+ superfamily ATPase|uniref:ATP-binding protein n=1 Tax=Flavobacterium sp. TaxID=239 RepID=UPI0037C01545